MESTGVLGGRCEEYSSVLIWSISEGIELVVAIRRCLANFMKEFKELAATT